jgi:hypothetical protein
MSMTLDWSRRLYPSMNAVLMATRGPRPPFASRRSAISAGSPASVKISRRTARLSSADCPRRHQTGLPVPKTRRVGPAARWRWGRNHSPTSRTCSTRSAGVTPGRRRSSSPSASWKIEKISPWRASSSRTCANSSRWASPSARSTSRAQHSSALRSSSMLKPQNRPKGAYSSAARSAFVTLSVTRPPNASTDASATDTGASRNWVCCSTAAAQPDSAPTTCSPYATACRTGSPWWRATPRMYAVCISSSFHTQTMA